MYSNYLQAEDKEVIDRLSYFGFNGKYSKINDKYYIYIEKADLYAPRVGEITEEDLLRALKNKAVFIEKKNIEFENSFVRFNPEKTFTQQALYCSKMKKYFWWK